VAQCALLRLVKIRASLGLRRAVESRHRLIHGRLRLRGLHTHSAVA
jgi:hypothetical protein